MSGRARGSAASSALVERAQVVAVAGAGRQVDVEVGRDALERVVARAVQGHRERLGVGGEDLRGPVALVDVAVDHERAPGGAVGAVGAHAGERDGHVVEQAVAAGEVVAGVVRAAAEVHADAARQGAARGGDGARGRAPRALDERRRPRQPEPALLAHRQRAGAQALDQRGLLHGLDPRPTAPGRTRGSRPGGRCRRPRGARAAARTSSSGNLWVAGSGKVKRSWLQRSMGDLAGV